MARVLCDGAETLVRASDVVPGDVIVVEPDEDIPADARLVDASTLFVDEVHLTGTHTPIGKSAEAVAVDAALAERRSMVYHGTRVVRGREDECRRLQESRNANDPDHVAQHPALDRAA
jgi:Ca2+-transporting ATPase